MGYGQSWQDFTASRSIGVTYTNTTGRAIEVSAVGWMGSPGLAYWTVNGVNIYGPYVAAGYHSSAQAIVPPGATYSFNGVSGITVNPGWVELR